MQQTILHELEANGENVDQEEVEQGLAQFRNVMGNIQNIFQQNDPNQMMAGLANLMGQANPQLGHQLPQPQFPVQPPAAAPKVKRQISTQLPPIKLKRFDVPTYLISMFSTAIVVFLVLHFFLTVKPAHSFIKSKLVFYLTHFSRLFE